jgi:hypothetical protein
VWISLLSKGVAEGACSDQAVRNADREEFLNMAIHRHPAIFSTHVQFGGKAFKFLDKSSLKEQTEKHLSVVGGASIAFLNLPNSLVGFNVDASREYAESKTSTNVCLPLQSDVIGALRCDSRILGGPKEATKGTATIEWRHQIVQDSVLLLGIAVQAHYQVIKHDKPLKSVEVPIYFFQTKPEKIQSVALNGGVNAGWTSKDGFVARVFIGTAFKLLGSNIK